MAPSSQVKIQGGTNKDELRHKMRSIRHELALTVSVDQSKLLECFLSAIATDAPQVIAGYAAKDHEIDPSALMTMLYQRGHKLALPAIEIPDRPMVFRLFQPDQALQRGYADIFEPLSDAPQVIPDLVIVPLIAFDRRHTRLGYGKGFYDRTLASLRDHYTIKAIGLAYSGQEVTSLPAEPHDEPMDLIVTENGLI